jgi:hypothetical protein
MVGVVVLGATEVDVNFKAGGQIGCAAMIMIFVSLVLGLLMIPFLPHLVPVSSVGTDGKHRSETRKLVVVRLGFSARVNR